MWLKKTYNYAKGIQILLFRKVSRYVLMCEYQGRPNVRTDEDMMMWWA